MTTRGLKQPPTSPSDRILQEKVLKMFSSFFEIKSSSPGRDKMKENGTYNYSLCYWKTLPLVLLILAMMAFISSERPQCMASSSIYLTPQSVKSSTVGAKIYLFANNKLLKNTDISELLTHSDNDLGFFFNDPWPLNPEGLLPSVLNIPSANRWVFFPGCNWPSLYDSCINDTIPCQDAFAKLFASWALKVAKEGNVGKLVFMGGDALNVQRKVNISVSEMYIKPLLDYAGIEYPPNQKPSTGFVTFIYAEKTIASLYPRSSNLSRVVLVGFSGVGKNIHNFTFEQAYYKSRGVSILLPSELERATLPDEASK